MTLSSRPVRVFRATPRLPGDKSITHRAFLMSLLAGGPYRVTGANPGEDCMGTRRAVEALGVRVDTDADGVVLHARPATLRAPRGALDLGNSGTGLRLLLGILAGEPGPVTVTGDDSLRSRPMRRVMDPLIRMGAQFTDDAGHAPITVTGGPLRGYQGELAVPSAQVKSAILLAAVRATGPTRLTGTGATRDHTERMLRYFGALLEFDAQTVELQPGPLTARDLVVPGDPSAAAFHAAAAAIVPGSETIFHDVSLNPSRTGFLDVLERFGADVHRTVTDPGDEPRGTVRVTAGSGLTGVTLRGEDIAGIIDELPVLAVVASFASGLTQVRGAGELRVKESDRLATMSAALQALGGDCRDVEDGWDIQGTAGEPLPGGTVQTHGDHRVGMAALVAGLHSTRGARLEDDPRMETSDPYFLSNLNSLMETHS